MTPSVVYNPSLQLFKPSRIVHWEGVSYDTEYTERDLTRLSGLLQALSARILQINDAKARVAMGTATNVAVGSGFAASLTGLVGTFGTAGTGAVIAGLSGAAKTSATLAWIGGLVGGGVAAGTVLVGAGTLGAGVYGSIKLRRALLGAARRQEDLSERELRIIEGATILDATVRGALKAGAVSPRDTALLSYVAVRPLIEAVQTALADGVFDDMNSFNRGRLRGHLNNLQFLSKRLERNAASS